MESKINRLKKFVYNYPVEFILEAEKEANARDILNDIGNKIDFFYKDNANTTEELKKMNSSERIYHLTYEASKIMHGLGLNGWATQWDLEDDKTGEKAEVKVKFEVIKDQTKKGGKTEPGAEKCKI